MYIFAKTSEFEDAQNTDFLAADLANLKENGTKNDDKMMIKSIRKSCFSPNRSLTVGVLADNKGS